MAAMTAMLILSGVGMAVSAYQQHKAGEAAATASEAAGTAQRQAAESEASIADYNAAVANLQAKDAVDRGAEDESRFRSQVKVAIGGARAATAQRNIDVGFGSAVDVQADAAHLGELDALTIRTNAAREAWGYKVQSTDYTNRAGVARKTGYYAQQAGQAAGAAQRTAGNLNAIGTVASGGASLLMARYGWKN
jgi:pyruvate/2-oxoglutarate dehydrogenase complex dihydrolipoamide acyltransferase (E2) component